MPLEERWLREETSVTCSVRPIPYMQITPSLHEAKFLITLNKSHISTFVESRLNPLYLTTAIQGEQQLTEILKTL